MREGVADQVGNQLRQASDIAIHVAVEPEVGIDDAVGMGGVQFGDDLLHSGLQRTGRPRQGEPAAEPTAGEVENIVDQSGHAVHTGVHHGHHRGPAHIERLAAEERGAGPNGRQRVAQVVPEHGDELLPQFGNLALVVQPLQGGRLTSLQITLITAPAPGPDEHHPH